MSTIDLLFSGAWGPVIIFCLRIIDVSLSTVRMLLSVRGHKRAVPFIAFFEVMVWLFAAGNAMRHLESGWHVFGYATGYATGTLVGLWLEEKLALGFATIRIISRSAGADMADALRTVGFGVTEFAAKGREGPVEVVYLVIPRRDTARVMTEVEARDPTAFITVEQPREIRWGWMGDRRTAPFNPFRWVSREEK